MDKTLWGIVAVAAIAVVIFLSSSPGRAIVTDLLSGNSRDRSQRATTSTLVLRAPIGPMSLLTQIRASIEADPAFSHGFSCALDASAGQLIVSKAGLGAPSMQYAIVLGESDAGCVGWAAVLAWREAQGRTDAVAAIEALQACVRREVVSAGGDVAVGGPQQPRT